MSAVNRNKPKRARTSESTYTVMDFVRDYPDDATCLDYLWRRLYSPDGSTAECPKCGKVRRFHRVQSRPSYSCDTCGHHLHPTAGTIFHKSSTSLHLWFHAIFLMAQTRCGISAKQLERDLGVTYKTAWRMFKRIRSMLDQDEDTFGGTVELDETYVGGKRKGATGRPSGRDKKAPVFGMARRRTTDTPGKIVAKVVPNAAEASLMPHVRKHVLPSTAVTQTSGLATTHCDARDTSILGFVIRNRSVCVAMSTRIPSRGSGLISKAGCGVFTMASRLSTCSPISTSRSLDTTTAKLRAGCSA